MDHPANDNQPDGPAPLTFRDKVYLYYRDTKVLPGAAELLATHYFSALRRSDTFDPNHAPTLPGCEKFGSERSPREIVTMHAHSTHSPLKAKMRRSMIEAGIAAAEREILSVSQDVFGWPHKRPSFHRC
jgi:hypothetical protein